MLSCFFAGQGAQFPGMGKDLAEKDAEIMALFDKANEVLGFDIKTLCFEGPAEALTKSDICQPAIFIVSMACHKAFMKACPSVHFEAAAGLSLGEWTALCVAGVLDFETTLRILQARGKYMQEACNLAPSGMISIMGASAEQLKSICDNSGCTISNINSDSQQVISGTHEAVAKAAELAAAQGVKNVVLQVAGAFHSPFMTPAREKLAAFIKAIPFAQPTLPILSNATGTFHSTNGEEIKAAMLTQVDHPVHFSDCVKAVMKGSDLFVEFGPGKVLSGLIRRIDKANAVTNVQDGATLEATVAKLNA
ncbi:MAG: ACP S-malonyltransferase [Kiritimatiellia bacterium]